MISEMLLASYSFAGGSIGDVLAQWEQLGFFSYILPFLLIFSITFGVLTKTKIFEENRAINAIIALVVGFMSLQWGLVPQFFSELFPRVGVGISVLLIAILFLGIFLPRQNWAIYLFFAIGAIIVMSVLVNSSSAMGWYLGDLFNWDWQSVLPWLILIILVGVVVASSIGRPKTPFEQVSSSFFKGMHKD